MAKPTLRWFVASLVCRWPAGRPPFARSVASVCCSRLHEIPTLPSDHPIFLPGDFEALPDRGAQARVNGTRIIIGGPRLLIEGKVSVPPEVEKLTTAWATDGKTVLYVVAGAQLLGAFAVEDEIRPESKEAVTELHQLGIRVAMITGDSKTVADSVARRIGIDEVAAEVLPADKASAVKRFQSGGTRIAMVGDGVNDAPALATADVGIGIGAGTDVAIESAGIVLVRSDPRAVVGAIKLSRATYRKMIQNLVWATAYNLVAIPVAGGLLVRWGLDLPMSVGAVAMSLSTIIVSDARMARGSPANHLRVDCDSGLTLYQRVSSRGDRSTREGLVGSNIFR
jgi:P-type Cu2+ transporter